MSRRRLRAEEGFQLIELLIAMTILAIGIMAIVAGFSSGMVALRNASRASTGAAIADRQMEAFRRIPFASVNANPPPGTPIVTTPVGPDARTYWMSVNVVWNCPITGSVLDTTTVPQPTCSAVGVPPVQSRAVKLVTIVVRDGSATAKLLVSEASTFDEATG